MNKATIHYHDIGDYLSREQKLGWGSISREDAKARRESVSCDFCKPNSHHGTKRDFQVFEFV